MSEKSKFKNFEVLKAYQKVSLLTDGWSKDLKFKLENGNEKRLLRLSSINLFEKKKEQYLALLPLADLDLNINKPLEFGTCTYNGEEFCFILSTWVSGNEASQTLLNLSKEKQYKLGLSFGQALQRIHSIPIQDKFKTLNWEKHFNKKLDKRIQMAKECHIKYEGLEDIVNYIEQNRTLLKDRPISFHHGDYHIGNFILDKDKIGIIDLNRMDHGDPWEEFNRITWCSSRSPEFASGRINGYFNNNVPDSFFELLAIYIGSNQLSSIPWAISFGQDQIDIMLSEVKGVLKSYDYFKQVVPDWYTSNC